MFSSEKLPDKALVLHPDVGGGNASRTPEASLEEIMGLSQAIDLEIVGSRIFKISKVTAGKFFGKGQIEQIAGAVEALGPQIVIVNHALSPVQQRNLEKDFKAKVIDRTGLILEIFGARAQTKEGRLQVELAALDYQRSRLVRSWTHLERQRGGAGFMGGPGETQIEIDRRLISERITKLKKELEDVRRTRSLGRKARAQVPFPVVALVGYTNAGKSTLFNRLTQANVFAEDLLFATLDPTLRRMELPNGQTVILSDTVGFISDLPTHLVAAFRATLEETLNADVIVHVCDVSQDDFEAQHDDVVQILKDLEIEYDSDRRVLEAWNKCDALDEDAYQEIKRKGKYDERAVLISAQSGEGIDSFLDTVVEKLSAQHIETELCLPYSQGAGLSWLYEHAEVLSREDLEQEIKCMVRIDSANLSIFKSRYQKKTG